jgi:site-specific recombinase XerC
LIAKGGRTADVFLPDALMPKLDRFWRYKRRAGEGLDPDSPLFCNQSGQRISKRRVQAISSTGRYELGSIVSIPCTR